MDVQTATGNNLTRAPRPEAPGSYIEKRPRPNGYLTLIAGGMAGQPKTIERILLRIMPVLFELGQLIPYPRVIL